MVEQPANSLDNRKSESQACTLIACRLPEPIKLTEDVLAVFLSDTNSGIPDFYTQLFAALAAADDNAALWRVAHRV